MLGGTRTRLRTRAAPACPPDSGTPGRQGRAPRTPGNKAGHSCDTAKHWGQAGEAGEGAVTRQSSMEADSHLAHEGYLEEPRDRPR